MIEKAVEFIKKSKNRIVIIYGHDCDSIASAAVTFRLLEKLGKKPSLLVSSLNYDVTEKEVRKVEKLKPDRIVVLDINANKEIAEELEKRAPTMVIDHHVPKKYEISCYVNPRRKNANAYVPVSYIVWKVYSRFFDPKEVDWISAIGTLGDHGVESNRDLFLFLKKHKKELVKGKLTSEALFKKSLLGRLTKMVNAAHVIGGKKGVLYATKLLIRAKDYKEIEKDSKLKKWYQELEKELKRIEKDFQKNKVVVGPFILYVFTSKYSLKSTFAGKLPQKHRKKILIIGQKFGRRYEFSLRKGEQVKVDLTKLIEKFSKFARGIEGGGHPSAAGMRMPTKVLEKFIEKLKKEGKGLLG